MAGVDRRASSRFAAKSPFDVFLSANECMFLDGGLATALELHGHVLNDALWSARLLAEAPEAIARVHHEYLQAGADCIITASYQASIAGFLSAGYSHHQARELLRSAARVAVRSRDDFYGTCNSEVARPRPLVAASIGPFGAYRADGSEYTGRYGVGAQVLAEFHRERFALLAESEADVIAIETLPCALECNVLLDLLSQHPGRHAWFSFSCRDDKVINDGTAIEAVAKRVAAHPQVVAIGVNCTAPQYTSRLIERLKTVSDRPIIVYPNSGEKYNATHRCWSGEPDPVEFAERAVEWFAAGAQMIGGCCRTGAEHVRLVRAALSREVQA